VTSVASKLLTFGHHQLISFLSATPYPLSWSLRELGHLPMYNKPNSPDLFTEARAVYIKLLLYLNFPTSGYHTQC